MTFEELKVRVTLDTSGLKSDINKAKKSINDLNTETQKAMSGAGSGASATSEQLAELYDTMEAVKSLNFAELFIGNFDKVKAATSNLNKWVKHDFSDLKAHIGALKIHLKGRDWGSAGMEVKNIFEQIGTGASNTMVGVKELWGTIAGVAKVVLAVGMVAAAFATLKNAITRAQEVTKQAFSAERIGMTTNEFSEWGYVIQQTGGEIDELTDYIKTLSDVQNQVREGTGEMVAIYEKLGMSAEEVSNMSQTEMFARTIEGLQNVRNEVERTSMAYKIFGEDDAAKVTTLLNLNNAEIQQMINNYHMLGGAMSGGLIENSKILTGALGNLRTAWTGLKNTLAEVFLPVIIPVVQWLVKAVAVVNMFIRAIFGKDIVVASSGITDVASAYTGYTNAADKATTSTNKVTEAVERLKRVTMGFDELNKLSSMAAPSSSGTDGGDTSGTVGQLPSGGGIGGLDIPTTEDLGLDGIAEWIEKYRQPIADITALLLTLGGIALAVFCFLHGNIVGGIAGLALAGIGIAVGTQEGGIWDRLFEGIKTTWGNVKAWFGEHVAPIFTKDWWITRWDMAKAGVVEGVTNILTAIKNWWTGVKEWWSTRWNAAVTGIKEGVQNAWNAIKDSKFMTFFSNLKDKAVTLVAEYKEKGAEKRARIKEAWDKVKNKTAEMKAYFKEYGARKTIAKYWKEFKTTTRTLKANFKASGAYKTISKYWNAFKTKTSTITVAFKDAFTSKIKSVWNGLVKAINKAISTINKIPGVNIPKLPYLARGGITTGPTAAVIGEAGREAVLPLENNTGWMDTLADKISARNGGGGPTKVVLMVDGKQLGWATIDNINSITKQTGVLPLQLA